MEIKTSQVYKCLEKKTLIFGFEIFDVFLVCILLSVLNIVFSTSDWKLFYTWLPVAGVAIGLRTFKRGKPDNYLLHYLRFQFSPGIYSAFTKSKNLRSKGENISLLRRLNSL
jgi:hypothetical protein